MKLYNKLIRDHIPQIIEAAGQSCDIQTLDSDAYQNMLDKKLDEELREYQDSGEIAELLDLVEVVYAIANNRGVSIEEFERLRQAKRDERGGFDRRLLLVSVTD